MSIEERQAKTRALISEIEADACEQHPHPLGVAAILGQSPFAKHALVKRRAPKVHAATEEARAAFLAGRQQFLVAYGEMVRRLFPQIGFTRPERDEHVRRLGFLASKLEQQGVCVVAATVSPYADSRAFVRSVCRNFLEVHVATPVAECQRRDPKGLYAQARRGEIRNFTGVDDPYEAPLSPEVRVDPGTMTIEQAGAQILAAVQERMRYRAGPTDGSGDVAETRKSLLDDRLAVG